MAEAVVKLFDLGDAHATGSVLNKPFPESIDKSPVLTAGNFSGTFNGSLVSTKGNVLLHEDSVHEIRAITQSLCSMASIIQTKLLQLAIILSPILPEKYDFHRLQSE